MAAVLAKRLGVRQPSGAFPHVLLFHSARLSEDRGEPLLRRLREHCEAVVFE